MVKLLTKKVKMVKILTKTIKMVKFLTKNVKMVKILTKKVKMVKILTKKVKWSKSLLKKKNDHNPSFLSFLLWGFWENYEMNQYTTLGQKIVLNIQILFLTPSGNLKLYFCVFDHFIHKSFLKNLTLFQSDSIYPFYSQIPSTPFQPDSIYHFYSHIPSTPFTTPYKKL